MQKRVFVATKVIRLIGADSVEAFFQEQAPLHILNFKVQNKKKMTVKKVYEKAKRRFFHKLHY